MKAIDVSVVGSGHSQWTEQWTPDQLAYFILMADVPEQKFAAVQSMDAVPCGPNEYRWDRSVLSEAEFEELRRQFPVSAPRSFVRADCEQITLLLALGWDWGMTLDTPADRVAVKALIDVCQADLEYWEFNYQLVRHLYRSTLTAEKIARLQHDHRKGYKALASTLPELAEELKSGRAAGRPLVFGCREPGFKPPLAIWQEA